MEPDNLTTANNWQTFWSSRPNMFGTVMQKNAAFFTRILVKNKIILPGQRILDYGSGWGSLAVQLKGMTRHYLGLDISPACVEFCQKTFADEKSFHFDTITAENPDISLKPLIFKEEPFDLIIILSVIQYFRNCSRVEMLLAACEKIIGEKGKIILADVIQSDNSVMKDVISNLKDSIKNGYLFSFILFLVKARFSSYNKIRANNHLLSLSERELADICQRLNLKYELMPICTLQHSRVSYCITKSTM